MARLTTHVLDTAQGAPASGVVVELHAIARDHSRHLVTSTVTDADGRTAPLLSGDRIDTGVYELTFHMAEYFAQRGVVLPDPPFLGVVVIRIGVADEHGHYHVPLLVSPYGYSSYRGS